MLLGPSNGVCSNLLKTTGVASMAKMLISHACLTLPDDQIRCESYCRRFTMICSQKHGDASNFSTVPFQPVFPSHPLGRAGLEAPRTKYQLIQRDSSRSSPIAGLSELLHCAFVFASDGQSVTWFTGFHNPKKGFSVAPFVKSAVMPSPGRTHPPCRRIRAGERTNTWDRPRSGTG